MGSPAFATQRSKLAAFRFCAHTHRLVRGPMGEGIADQIREQLSDPRAVAVDAFRQFEAGLDHALGRGRPQFVDDLLEDRLQRPGVTAQRDAASQPPAREIQDVVDEVRHAGDGGIDHVEDAEVLVLLQRAGALQDPRAGADRCKRVAEVVTEHGDELLAQFRGLPLRRQTFLKLRP